MDEPLDDLEPLFDYSRVQPPTFVCLDDDDDWDSLPKAKRPKSSAKADEMGKEKKCDGVVAAEGGDGGEEGYEEEDWLPPPPPPSKIPNLGSRFDEDKTLQELRLQKQVLASFAQSAEDVLRAVVESVKTKNASTEKTVVMLDGDQPPKPQIQRQKIVISIQDKDGQRQFRIYMDDKFERLFKKYAEKAKLNFESLIFLFDGEKVSPEATPQSLSMENDDMIEAHVKAV